MIESIEIIFGGILITIPIWLPILSYFLISKKYPKKTSLFISIIIFIISLIVENFVIGGFGRFSFILYLVIFSSIIWIPIMSYFFLSDKYNKKIAIITSIILFVVLFIILGLILGYIKSQVG